MCESEVLRKCVCGEREKERVMVTYSRMAPSIHIRRNLIQKEMEKHYEFFIGDAKKEERMKERKIDRHIESLI